MIEPVDGLLVAAVIVSGIANLLAACMVLQAEKINRANIEFCKWLIDEVKGGNR